MKVEAVSVGQAFSIYDPEDGRRTLVLTMSTGSEVMFYCTFHGVVISCTHTEAIAYVEENTGG